MFMHTGRWTSFAATGLFALCLGCDGGGFALAYHDHRPPRRVYVDSGPVHICTHDCHHHYWDGGKLVMLKGHRHGPGCGHVFERDRWIRVSARPGHVRMDAGPVHICTRDCHHHYWDGGKLVMLKGHRHGPGCGHVFERNHWVISDRHHGRGPAVDVRKAPAVYPPRGPAVNVKEGPKRIKKGKHVHGPRCGCVYDGRADRWVKVKKDHVHGPGCGHVRVGGKWSKRR